MPTPPAPAVPVLERLDRLHTTLHELLDVLARGDWEADRVAQLQARADGLAAEVGDPAALWERVPEDEHPRLRTALEGWLRDVALVQSAVSRDRERLLVDLDRTRAGLRSHRARHADPAPGGVCDISG